MSALGELVVTLRNVPRRMHTNTSEGTAYAKGQTDLAEELLAILEDRA